MEFSLGSDNYSGIHPEILKVLADCNSGYAVAYGEDELTPVCHEVFKRYFGKQARAFLMFNGTAANTVGIGSIVKPYHGVICSEQAHINVHECGALEKLSGVKLMDIPEHQGKLSIDNMRPLIKNLGDEHEVQPKVISITQSTELGTLYSIEEIKAIANFAHAHEMYLHVDGSRLANAAAALGVSFQDMTTDLGVDLLSFGGTKNGLLMAESVVFLNENLGHDFQFYRKQGMQLFSKMRYLSAQYKYYLESELWKRNASHANEMAAYLASKLQNHFEFYVPVQTNMLFVIIPEEIRKPLQHRYKFHCWNEEKDVVRLVTSFDTKLEHLNLFLSDLNHSLP